MRSSTTTLQADSPDEQELSCLLALQKALAVREPPLTLPSVGCACRFAAQHTSQLGEQQTSSCEPISTGPAPAHQLYINCPPGPHPRVSQPLSLPSAFQHRTWRGAVGARSEHSDQGTHHQGEGFPCDHAAFGLTRAEPSLPEGRADQTHCSVTQAAQCSGRSHRGDSPTPPSPFRTGQGTAQPLHPSGRKVQSRMTQLGQKSTPAQGLQDI